MKRYTKCSSASFPRVRPRPHVPNPRDSRLHRRLSVARCPVFTRDSERDAHQNKVQPLVQTRRTNLCGKLASHRRVDDDASAVIKDSDVPADVDNLERKGR